VTEITRTSGHGWPRRGLESAGLVLALALSGGFVWQALRADWSAVSAAAPASALTGLAVASLVYAALGACLAFSWTQIVIAMGGAPGGQWSIHATTQALKYLPGNVAHLAGRHALARRRGVSDQVLLAAAPMEAASMILAAGLVSALAGPAIWPLAAWGIPSPAWLLAGLLACAALMVGMFVVLRTYRHRLLAVWPRQGWRRLAFARALCGHIVFFLGCGTIGVLLLTSLEPQAFEDLPFLRLTSVLALAWLAGFLIPGAPAGMGVRETVILALVAPMHGAAAATGLAALYRIATFGGDTVIALAGLTGTLTIRSLESEELDP
jgi:hypothetical protein